MFFKDIHLFASFLEVCSHERGFVLQVAFFFFLCFHPGLASCMVFSILVKLSIFSDEVFSFL